MINYRQPKHVVAAIPEARCERAENVLAAHYTDRELQISEALTDLLHLCLREGVSFKWCVRHAVNRFELERACEPPSDG